MGRWGAKVVNFFFKHGHVAYQINDDDGQNRMQVKFHPSVKVVNLGEVKGQISLNFGYHVNFKDFYTKLCMCSHK